MPPTPRYALSWSNTGAFGNAMREVAYERTVGDTDDIEELVTGVDGQRALRTWLAVLGGRDTARACSFAFRRTVTWSGRWTLQQIVRRQQAEVRGMFSAMVRELERRHLVQPEQARRLAPPFDLDLYDYRNNRSQPLPGKERLLGNG